MTTRVLYCPTCGAANDVDQTQCIACLHQLDTTTERPLLRKRYHLLRQLGAGGYGAVYQVEDVLRPELSLAIKQINLRGLDTRQIIEATETFQRERLVLERLDHPHLPHFYETFEDAEHWYLVIDYFPGETLEAYLAALPLPRRTETPQRALVEEVLRCGLRLCDLLRYLHTREPAIIFRDLKPSNIIRGPDGSYALIDFGIARTVKPGQLKDTIPLGSPGYAAPEQYGRAQTDARADIYSLGAILHQMLSGDDPGERPLHFTPLDYTDLVLKRLETLILRMVALHGEERPASVDEVAEELRALRQAYEHPGERIWTPGPGQTPPWAIQPVSEASQAQPQPAPLPLKSRRRRRLLAGLATGTLLLIGANALDQNRLLAGLLDRVHRQQIPSGSSVQSIVKQQEGEFLASGPTPKLMQLAWRPGKIALALTVAPPEGPGILYSWEKGSSEFTMVTALFPQMGPQSIAWAPDGGRLALVQNDSLQIWGKSDPNNSTDVYTPSMIYPLPVSSAGGHYHALIWAPNDIDPFSNNYDNKIIYTLGQEIDTLDLATQQSRLIYNEHIYDPAHLDGSAYLGLSPSPDGKYIASTSNHAEVSQNMIMNPLRIWRVADGQTVATIQPFYGFSWLQWSPNSRYLVSASSNKAIGYLFIYDIFSQQKVFEQPFPQQESMGSSLSAWSPDSKYILCAKFADYGNGSIVQVVEIATGHVLYALDKYQYPTTFSWSPDGRTLAIAYTDFPNAGGPPPSFIVCYDASNGQERLKIDYPGSVDILQWASIPNSLYLAVNIRTAVNGPMTRIYQIK